MTEPLSVNLVLTTEQVDAIAHRVADLLTESRPVEAPPPYMTIVQAAEYLCCKRQRIDDLLSQRRLTRHKDGRRTLVSRAELDEYLSA